MMIPMFVFVLNDVRPEAISTSYLLEIFGGVITALLIVVAFFLKSLHSDFKGLKHQVYENKEKISENILKDDSDSKEFISYKELIKEKDKHFEETLKQIDESIKSLTKVTGDLNISVAKLQEKIK